MKTFVLFLLFFLPVLAYAQAAEASYPNDTILHRVQDGIPHTIYIEKNKEATTYSELTNFSFDRYHQEEFDRYYNILKKKHPQTFTRHPMFGLPQHWLPLFSYNGNYCAYSPCDRGFTGRRILSDSLVMYQYPDGPFPYLLDTIRELKPGHFLLKTTPPFNNPDIITKPLELHIYILNTNNQMAVWGYKDEKSKEYRFRLYVPAKHVREFALIVNQCLEKEEEFDFEHIDFEELLKTNGFQLP